MLYYSTTTNKRYNERTLALYGFSPEDSDVHELKVVYPNVRKAYETYRDTQDIEVLNGQYLVKFEIVDLPRERIIENIQPHYEQEVQVVRNQNVTVDGHTVRYPENNLPIFKAWRSALADGITFEPTDNPFVTPTPTMTLALADAIIAGIESHLAHCDTLSGEVQGHLDTAPIADLKATTPGEWATARYNELVAA